MDRQRRVGSWEVHVFDGERVVVQLDEFVDARLVEQVPPRFESDPSIEDQLSPDRLEHQIDHDLGVLVQAFKDSRDESFGLYDGVFEAEVACGEEREDEEDEQSPDVGFCEGVEGCQAAEASLEQSTRDLGVCVVVMSAKQYAEETKGNGELTFGDQVNELKTLRAYFPPANPTKTFANFNTAVVTSFLPGFSDRSKYGA